EEDMKSENINDATKEEDKEEDKEEEEDAEEAEEVEEEEVKSESIDWRGKDVATTDETALIDREDRQEHTESVDADTISSLPFRST
ncbi:hypothetical protein BGZ98_006823, partial [Dissophora globulifera]